MRRGEHGAALRETGMAAREARASRHAPISHLGPDGCLVTKDGDLVAALEITRGVSHETAGQDVIDQLLDERAHLLTTIAGGDLGLWAHVTRRRITLEGDGAQEEGGAGFAAALDRAWLETLDERGLYETRRFLTLVVRPPVVESGLGLRVFDKALQALSKRSRGAGGGADEQLGRMREAIDALLGGLGRYGARRLGPEDALGLYAALLSGDDVSPLPLPEQDLSTYAPRRRISFGRELIEFSGAGPEQTRLGAMIGVKAWSASTGAGVFDAVEGLPFEFTLTQSLTFMSRSAAEARIRLAHRRAVNMGDGAVSLTAQLGEALDDAASGRSAFAEHQANLLVFGQDADEAARNSADAVSALTGLGLQPVREDGALEAAFWSMLPGNAAYRVRKAMLSTANIAGLISLHAAPRGKTAGLHWGAPICVMETAAREPYAFNLHVHDVGNAVLFGPTGAGKTALLGFLIAQAQGVTGLRTIVIDKDRGLELLVRALGGRYAQAAPGAGMRLNPFAFEDAPEARSIAVRWVCDLLSPEGAAPTAEERMAAARAVDLVMGMPFEARRLSLLREGLEGDPAAAALLPRLALWVDDGQEAWAFDHGHDDLADLLSAQVTGIDITGILDERAARGPWMAHVFAQIERSLDGSPTLIVLDEAWRLLDDGAFAAQIKDWLKTIRKKNGAVIFATQEPEDAANSPIGRTVIAQSPTQLLLPNPRASEAAYREGLRLSERELEIVRTAPAAARRVLIRHDDDSVIVRFDLGGAALAPFLAVLSGRRATVREAESLRARHGDDPKDWLPAFMAAHGKKETT